MSRPTRALVDLAALRHNAQFARSLAPAARLLAVVKSDGYGHGAVEVVRALHAQADAFGVACIEEAQALRAAGLRAPVLLMEGVFEPAELAIAARENFWLMVENTRQIEWLERSRNSVPFGVWIKVDTGMSRLGFAAQELPGVRARLAAMPSVAPGIVVATHLACADEPDHPLTRAQLARLAQATEGSDAQLSIANSPALLAWPAARAAWSRAGYMLYGGSPFGRPDPVTAGLRPVMTLESAIVSLRDLASGDSAGYGATWTARRPTRLATVPIGYSDGYPRSAASGTPVLVGGHRAALAGRVSMDMLMVDVTDVPEVHPGMPVQLWGPQLDVDTVAAHCGTIGYELLVRVSPRVPRVYRS
ncbi:MAG: Alanine racemase, biosynthetic [Pseudomonadales bacterium]|nr:Alanine racemase, biosynthetic [Pseudomonadales bacterium]